jgi:putative proteasome-type protease
MNRQTIYETVRYIGSKVRAVEKRDRAALEADGFSFNINLIVGGQIAGMQPEVHLIYPQGNSIHATRESPFLQIGEAKYGKPILDRGFSYDTALPESNVSVGPPVDILCYEKDSLQARMRARLDADDPYLQEISEKWQAGIIKLVNEMPSADFGKPVVNFASAA